MHKPVSREVRIAAVADWLIGVSLVKIGRKYKIHPNTVCKWIKRHGDHFKFRIKPRSRPRKKKRELIKIRSEGGHK